jgi:hypothetical protein
MRAMLALHSYFANQQSSIDNHQSITLPCPIRLVRWLNQLDPFVNVVDS